MQIHWQYHNIYKRITNEKPVWQTLRDGKKLTGTDSHIQYTCIEFDISSIFLRRHKSTMNICPKCRSVFSLYNISTVFSIQYLICIICSYTVYVFRLKQCKATRLGGMKHTELLTHQRQSGYDSLFIPFQSLRSIFQTQLNRLDCFILYYHMIHKIQSKTFKYY